MIGLRYLDPESLPAGLPTETREIVEQMHRTSPLPTIIKMFHPEWYMVTDEVIRAWEDAGVPESVVVDLRLMKRTRPYETPEAFLLIAEKRIGKELLALYRDTLLECAKHRLAGQLVPTEIPQLSTEPLELVVQAIHDRYSKLVIRNSNHCECYREYKLLEEQKRDLMEMFATGGGSFNSGKILIEQGTRLLVSANRLVGSDAGDSETASELAERASKLIEQGTRLTQDAADDVAHGEAISKTAFESKIEVLDKFIKRRWPNATPAQFGLLGDDVCEYCGKPKELDPYLVFGTKEFVHQMIQIAIGGTMPLSSAVELAEAVFSQIYNPDMIPASKKKAVAAFVEKIQLEKVKDVLMAKFLGLFGIEPLTPSLPIGGDTSKTAMPSTPISPTNGTFSRPMLTDDLRPAKSSGYTEKSLNDDANTATSSDAI